MAIWNYTKIPKSRRVHLEYEDLPIPAWNLTKESQKEINHKDENRANNRLDNLELITKTQNNNYGSRTRRQAAKLTKAVYQYTLDKKVCQILGRWGTRNF